MHGTCCPDQGQVREGLGKVSSHPAFVFACSSLTSPTSLSIKTFASTCRPVRAYCSTSQKEHARKGCAPGSRPSTPLPVR